MSAVFAWHAAEQEWEFEVTDKGSSVPPGLWAQHAPIVSSTGQQVGTGALLRLLDEGRGFCKGARVVLPVAEVVALSDLAARSLSLPPRCPFILTLQGSGGGIADPHFQINASWKYPSKAPVMGVSVQGALLKVSAQTFLISDAHHAALRGVAAFNIDPGSSPIERLQALAKVLGSGAEDVLAAGNLAHVNVVSPGTVSIRPYVRPDHEVDFEVVPLRGVDDREGQAPNETAARELPVLPSVQQARFEEAFRKFSTAKAAYAAGTGNYLVVPVALRRVFDELRRLQEAPSHERMAFIRSPHAVLGERLGDEVSGEELEALFRDTAEYSDRVREIGVWLPKVLPFIRPSGESWLPPEEGGLRSGSMLTQLRRADAVSALAEVRTAIAAGQATATVNGEQVAATGATVEAIEELIREFDRPPDMSALSVERAQELLATAEAAQASGQTTMPVGGREVAISHELVAALRERAEGTTTSKTTSTGGADERMALLIDDNLETLSYAPAPRTQVGYSTLLPDHVATALMDHQLVAFRWLCSRWATGRRGALLADDMGLGKTLSVIAFLSWLQEQASTPPAPILVVAPTGLLRNWMSEIETHLDAPRLGRLLEVRGASLSKLRRPGMTALLEQSQGLPALDVDALSSADLVLTSYEAVRDYQMSFGRVRWSVLVMDEAQKVKNPAARVTEALKAMNAEFRIAATGTPVENRPQDVWSIVDGIEPGALGALKAFVNRFEPEDGSLQDLGALREQLCSPADGPLMMRRLKADHIKGLPSISHEVIPEHMPQAQADAYDQCVTLARKADRTQQNMLKTLMELRRVSLHPLVDATAGDDEFFDASARTRVLVRILDAVRAENERALVFLNSLDMLDQLVERLQRRYGLASPPLVISGGVPGPERQSRVEAFQRGKGFDVMLLSPRAGGVGLTLHAANHVVHLDRWWNPAVEDQCTDRVYRIGQFKPVKVYMPLALHPVHGDSSFDSRLHRLLEGKRTLSRTLLAPTVETAKDITDLFEATIQ